MKRIVFSLLLVFQAAFIFAQSANVQSASDHVRHKEWAKAKQFIDLAAENPKTANDPKMWYYRGVIYAAISRDTTELAKSEPDAVEKAAISFMNSIKTDKGKYHIDDSYSRVWSTGVGLFNKGMTAYSAGDYERAKRFYNLIFEIFPYDKDNNLKQNNVTPDAVTRKLYFVAMKMGDKAQAKSHLQKLLDAKYNDPMIYLYMDQIYLEERDTAKAVAIIEKGLSLYEDNTNLINEQIRLYAAQGKTTELIDRLTASIEGGVENEVLYFIRGTLYQSKNNIDKATEDFKKAIELKPDYLDANFTLGAMILFQAAAMAKETEKITATDAFNKAKAQFEEKFKEAQPYLEKAFEINPRKTEEDQVTFQQTIIKLKQLYARTNQMDKYEQMKAEAEKK